LAHIDHAPISLVGQIAAQIKALLATFLAVFDTACFKSLLLRKALSLVLLRLSELLTSESIGLSKRIAAVLLIALSLLLCRGLLGQSVLGVFAKRALAKALPCLCLALLLFKFGLEQTTSQ
jgi:hypothetical protein